MQDYVTCVWSEEVFEKCFQHHLWLILSIFSVLSIPSLFAEELNLSRYKLSSGDLIKIQVYGEPDLTVDVTLNDSGTLTYPFLGEVSVDGVTARELKKIITRGLLGDYLIDPKVTVRIMQYRNFYVNGEVMRPGGFPYQPSLTVRKAISLAGGFTERASKSKLYVIDEADKQQKPKKVSLNYPISPGDIVTVEQSLF